MSGSKLNVLVANHSLDKIGGTEVYTFAIIEELLRINHQVEYFTFQKGLVSNKIEELGVIYKSKNKYDLILSNHTTCVKHLKNYGFIIQTCHGVFPQLEQPSPYADAHISISEEVQTHLLTKGYKSNIIFNGINLQRFKPVNSLNKEIKSILSLSQSEEFNLILSQICLKLNLILLINNKNLNSEWEIEKKINCADLVFGLGRSAFDAISCGRTVIIVDKRDYMNEMYGDGYVNKLTIKNFIKNNCSGRYSSKIFHENKILEEILKYDSIDGENLRKFAEENLCIRNCVQQYFAYYSVQRKNFNILIKRCKNFIYDAIFLKNRLIYGIKVLIYNLMIKGKK